MVTGVFACKTVLLEQKNDYFRHFEKIFKAQRAKEKLSDNSGHNILELCKISEKFDYSISGIRNI